MISPEFISCNIDTSRVTTKQYYEIILFYMLLLNETDIFREFLPNTSLFSQKMYQAILLSLSMLIYSGSLSIGISANTTFRTVFCFKKLKIIQSILLRYLLFFVTITSVCLSQISLTNQKGKTLKIAKPCKSISNSNSKEQI